jgi:rhamnogalacturonyl hydrolase YesR
MNLSLAQEKARRVYEFMKRGNAGLKRETANEVDHDPASWGMDIDDWDWNAGVGMTAISDYYEKTQQPEVLEYISSWVAKNKHQCAKRDHVNHLTPLAMLADPRVVFSFTAHQFRMRCGQIQYLWLWFFCHVRQNSRQIST